MKASCSGKWEIIGILLVIIIASLLSACISRFEVSDINHIKVI